MRSLALSALISVSLALAGEAFADQTRGAPAAEDLATGASAIAGPFAIGVRVKDNSGKTIGRITRLTTGPDGRTLVMVRLGSDSFAVPAARLRMDGDTAVSDLSRDELKAEAKH